MNTWDFLDEFKNDLEKQLRDDENRWGTSWLVVSKQEFDGYWIAGRILEYVAKFLKDGTKIPWMKVAGYSLIMWIRKQHPEIWNKEER